MDILRDTKMPEICADATQTPNVWGVQLLPIPKLYADTP